jgi:hypothetical protein
MMEERNNVPILLAIIASTSMCFSCSPEPVKIQITPEEVVLEGADATQKLEAKVLDKDGKPIPELKVVWFADDPEHIKLSSDGAVSAVASGESKVEAEVVGAKLKAEVPIRIKIPTSIHVSHERLRLWTGQVKENVWAEVHSEKDAFIEGYYPHWESEDPEIVKVEDIKDPSRRQRWVRLTGMKSGTTYIAALYKTLSKRIRVAVYDEDEEVALDGTRIPKKTEGEDEEKEQKGKKKKKKRKKK